VDGPCTGDRARNVHGGICLQNQEWVPRLVRDRQARDQFPDQRAVLLFSKSTGFRHESSINSSKTVFAELAKVNNWFLYETEEGGVFNPEQLSKFNVVIFNNSTGRVLMGEQQKALEQYVENGGSLIGIHGAGDDSHHWIGTNRISWDRIFSPSDQKIICKRLMSHWAPYPIQHWGRG